MPPDGQGPVSGDSAGAGAARPERKQLVAFAADAATETALREGLRDLLGGEAEVRRGGADAAIAALQKMPTPLTLVVDVSDHPQPLEALEALANVIEPDVRVLVVGDREDLGFYRQVTRGLGAVDYLYKPLTPSIVAQVFGPLLSSRPVADWSLRGGRIIAVTGARGGVGATTIASNLAWFFANVANRHTVLLDADLHTGTAALLLSGQGGPGLRNAFEHPERVDGLFIERTAQVLSERLHLLAGEENLGSMPLYEPGAAERLIDVLRRRYNYIVLDLPFRDNPMSRDLLALAHQRVVVMEPSLPSVRDALRLMQVPSTSAQPHRALLVMNRAGRKGGLKDKQVSEAMRLTPDLVIPDLPKRIDDAAMLGEPATAKTGPFRRAIASLAFQSGNARSTDVLPKKRRFGIFGR